MPEKSLLKFARTSAGYRLRLEGKGTMLHSQAAEIFVGQALAQPDVAIVVDLSACHYLDSTFLGCLVGLSDQHGRIRFRVATPAELTRKLFGAARMDLVLTIVDELPEVIGDYMAISPESTDSREMARHIMECHRRLAEVPGPQQSAFAAIARQMANELETRG